PRRPSADREGRTVDSRAGSPLGERLVRHDFTSEPKEVPCHEPRSYSLSGSRVSRPSPRFPRKSSFTSSSRRTRLDSVMRMATVPTGSRSATSAATRSTSAAGIRRTMAASSLDGRSLPPRRPLPIPANSSSSPPQRADISFGFAAGEDGLPIPNADPAYLDPPTPRAVNTANTVQFVSDTMFSVGRGFFTEPFMLEIETRTPGATIRYTTDGSAPTPTSGEIYTGPILIDGTTVVRAIAYRSGFEPTNVDTQTYLFLGDVIEQPKLPEGYPST